MENRELESSREAAAKTTAMAKTLAGHARRAAAKVLRRTVLGCLLGFVLGGASFFVQLSFDALEPGILRWLWLPVYVFLGTVGFGIWGWYGGLGRAYSYLLVDCGLVKGIVEGIVGAVLGPIAAFLGSDRFAGTSIADALPHRLGDDDELGAAMESALEKARAEEGAGEERASLAARIYGRVRRTVYDRVTPRLEGFVSEAVRIEAEKASGRDDAGDESNESDGAVETALQRLVDAIRIRAVDEISRWIAESIEGMFDGPARVAAAVPLVVFIVIPLVF